MLSKIAILHADDGYSRHVNLYSLPLFTVWFQFIRQMAPTCTVQEEGNLRGYGQFRGLKLKSCKAAFLGAFPIDVFKHFCCRTYHLATIHFVTERERD